MSSSLVLVVLAMLGIVAVAATVVVYVAYPHRGRRVPNLPWVGDAMRRGVAMLPTLDNLDERRRPGDGPGRVMGWRRG